MRFNRTVVLVVAAVCGTGCDQATTEITDPDSGVQVNRPDAAPDPIDSGLQANDAGFADGGVTGPEGACQIQLPGVLVEVTSPCDERTGFGTIAALLGDEGELPPGWSATTASVQVSTGSAEPWGDRTVSISYLFDATLDGDLGVRFDEPDVLFLPVAIGQGAATIRVRQPGTFVVARYDPEPDPECPEQIAEGNYLIEDAAGLAELSGVTTVEGNLSIRSNDSAGLEALSCLQVIGGSLSIQNTTGLPNVDGLRRLGRINGGIIVTETSGLTVFLLPNLRVSGGITLNRNQSLERVSFPNLRVSAIISIALNPAHQIDFGRLVYVRAGLSVSRNGTQTFRAPALRAVNSILSFDSNSSLTLVDLRALPEIVRGLNLLENGMLADETIFNFNALERIIGGVRMERNARVQNLDGFANLTEIDGPLTIELNGALSNTHGLARTATITGRLRVGRNTALTDLVLPALASLGGGVDIPGNGALANLDLNALPEIVGGLVFDENGTTADTTVVNLAALRRVTGGISIQRNPRLRNLDSLASLTEIDGPLTIELNTALLNTNGLGRIASITGRLRVGRNTALTDLVLPALVSLGAGVDIPGNGALANLDLGALSEIFGGMALDENGATAATTVFNFGALRRITGGVSIQRNSRLQTVDGFANLTEIDGPLTIELNTALLNTNGLARLSTVSGRLRAGRNVALTDLALPALTSLGGGVDIPGNGVLTNLDLRALSQINGALVLDDNGVAATRATVFNFAALQSVTGGLSIQRNPQLRNLSGFANLTEVSGLTIANNVQLPTCLAVDLANAVGRTGTIVGNLPDMCSP